MITYLKLTNFTRFSSVEFNFKPGTTAILAGNGAGKSSIINAIGIALFNSSLTQLNKLVKFGSVTATIELDFIYNDCVYKIIRKFGKSSESILHKNGNIICNGIDQVYTYISNLLELDLSHIYKNVIYVSSNNLVYPFLLDQAKRKVMFDQILGVERYQVIWEALREPAKLISSAVNDVNNKISHLDGKLSYINLNKIGLEELQQQIITLKERQESYIAYQNKADQIKKLSIEITKLRSDLSNQEGKLGVLIKKRDDLVNGVCFNCGSKIEPDDNVLKNTQGEVDGCLLDVANINYRIDGCLTDINLIRKSLGEEQPDVSLQLAAKQSELAYRLNQVDSIGEIEHAKTELNHELDRLNLKSSRLDLIRNGIRRIPGYLVDRHTTYVSRYASIMLSNLLDYDADVLFDQTYSTTVSIGDRSLDFTQLSEGEKVMVALSIRLTIINMLSSLNIAFLDEPTINLSKESRDRLAESIKGIPFKQLFVISHDDTFSSCVDNVIKL